MSHSHKCGGVVVPTEVGPPMCFCSHTDTEHERDVSLARINPPPKAEEGLFFGCGGG